MNDRNFMGNNVFKEWSFTTILSDGVSFHNVLGAPSKDVYYKREVVEVILVETPGGIKDEYYQNGPIV